MIWKNWKIICFCLTSVLCFSFFLPQQIKADDRVGTVYIGDVTYPVYRSTKDITSITGYYYENGNGEIYNASPVGESVNLSRSNNSFDSAGKNQGQETVAPPATPVQTPTPTPPSPIYMWHAKDADKPGSAGDAYTPPAPAPAPATKPTPATDHTGQLSWTPNVSIGEYFTNVAVPIAPDSNLLGNYIAIWYKFLVGLAGLLAMGMLIYGGAGWLMSGGSSAAVGEAKKTITSALIGLTLALLSYTALSFINPRLLIMKDLSLNTINVSTTDYQMGEVNLDAIDTSGMTAASTPVKKGNVDGFSKIIQNKNGQQVENLKPDLKGVVNGLADGCSQANGGNCNTIGINEAFRQGNGPHGTYEAIDIDRTNANFNTYMQSLTNGKTPAFWYYKDGTSSNVAPTGDQIKQAQPAYILSTTDGTRYRVINETQNNCWHIDIRK